MTRVITALRRLLTLGGALLLLVIGAPAVALADIGDEGSPAPLTDLEKVLFFIGIPVLILVICLLVFLRPGSGGARRYRPMRGWDADDAWFGITPPAAPSTPAPVEGSEEAGGSRGSW